MQTTVQRVSVNDVFMVHVKCEQGFESWQLVDLSGPIVFVVDSGLGAPPERHLPMTPQ